MVDIRFITDDEIPAFRAAISFGFGGDHVDEEGGEERFKELFPQETSIAAFDGERIVATFGSFDFDLTLPGGSAVPMAGTTIVTVHPTHRRQGILTTMMRMHLEQAIDRGQPMAGLWSSEPQIYGRFGFGPAADAHDLTIPTGPITLPEGPDDITVRFVEDDDLIDVLPAIYEQVRAETPGFLSRSESWWRLQRLYDPERRREGASSRRTVAAYRDKTPLGYATYRQKDKWQPDWLPAGTIEVMEIVHVDEGARRALWKYLTNIDLFPTVHWWNGPTDNPLYVEVDNGRHLKTINRDTLYVRILDVPKVLEARTYESDGSLVLGVTDDFLGQGGTFRLDITDGAGTCTETTDDPDITLDTADLGALILGRAAAIPRWRAGQINGSSESIHTLDRLLRTAKPPFCIEVF
ncbi:MAG: GNAT family N-acetyltransferase [Acidimicrobiia bacterium]|nr:GNAT family N-acetyltransferase [Acidimicrobiia bacterium]